jgi:NAD+ synthase
MLDNPKQVKQEIIEWIRNYFETNGKNCYAVIGISGGKDSSIAAALCAEALGKDKVVGVLMPNGVQPDIEDSKEVVEALGIPYLVINIHDSVTGLSNEINKQLSASQCIGSNELSRDAIINMPPRIRMSTLYAIGQCLPGGARVVNTCNRSEDYIGYSTKYGDSAGDFSPLSNLVVEEVMQIGQLCDIPKQLVTKTPSDGLSGMSDEEKIGFTYATLDHYILTGECEDPQIKEKIDRMHRNNLHKLQLMPAFTLKR